MASDESEAKSAKRGLPMRLLSPLWWVLESQWWVVIEHTDGLQKCRRAGSPTATMVLIWAPIMCFPQWLIAPLFGLQLETLAVFGARIIAMCIVRKLDGILPLTRALGLCHLLTFGPVLTILLMSNRSHGNNVYFDGFVLSQICVIGACLVQDARDFIFYLAGHPYPCYIREGVQAGYLQAEDPRALEKVTWRSRLLVSCAENSLGFQAVSCHDSICHEQQRD